MTKAGPRALEGFTAGLLGPNAGTLDVYKTNTIIGFSNTFGTKFRVLNSVTV